MASKSLVQTGFRIQEAKDARHDFGGFTMLGESLNSLIVNIVSTLLSAAIITWLGFMFRRKIVKAFRGEDLVARKTSPDFSIDIDGI